MRGEEIRQGAAWRLGPLRVAPLAGELMFRRLDRRHS